MKFQIRYSKQTFFIIITVAYLISRAVSNFYGTEIEIWASFRLVGSIEKNQFGPILSKF